MKNLDITKGSYVYEIHLLPTIEYENMLDGRHYLCLVWLKWYYNNDSIEAFWFAIMLTLVLLMFFM